MERDPRASELAPAHLHERDRASIFTRVLQRRKWCIVLSLAIAIASAFAIHQLCGPWHKASAQILVLKKRLDTQPISGPPTPGQPQDDYLPTHMLIIRSPRVVHEAVIKRNLASVASLRQPSAFSKGSKLFASRVFGEQTEGSPEWSLTESIVDSLKVSADNPKPGLGASHEVINVDFQGKDAKDCVKVLEAIIASYQDFLRDTYRNGSVETLELIDRAREVLQKEINTKEAAYREFRRKTPLLWKGKDNSATTVHQDRLFSVDAKRSTLLSRNAEIQASLDAIENALQGGKSYSEILPIISGVPANRELITPTQLGNARPNDEPWNAGRASRETLEEQLINLRLEERRLLKSGVGPAHPDMRAVRDRIDGVLGMISPSTSTLGHGQDQKEWAEELVKLKIRLLRQELSDNERTDKSLAKLFEHDQNLARESIVHEIEDQSHRDGIERSKILYESIIKRLQEIDSVKDFGGYNMHVLEPPQGKLQLRKYFLVLAAALVAGLLAGFGGACLAEMRDKSFRTPQEVCHWLGLPVLGQVPLVGSGRRPIHKGAFNGVHAAQEAYRAVRTALFFSTNASKYRVIQVTSPYAGDGKTTLAANLGFSIAQSGKKVLLLDADLRHPHLHSVFGLPNTPGLTSLLNDQADVTEAILETEISGLALLPSGPCPPNPAELLTSPRLKELLVTLRERFDYILIDTPPLLAVTDPCVVAHAVDGVLLTLRNSKHGRPHAQCAKEILDRAGANVLGVVVNGVTPRFAFAGYANLKLPGQGWTRKAKANRL